jgi:hypothetical protein
LQSDLEGDGNESTYEDVASDDNRITSKSVQTKTSRKKGKEREGGQQAGVAKARDNKAKK